MSGGLEAIERLLNDADGKFMDKLRQCRQGTVNVNLAVLADRTFNLRQQVAHNAALMSDSHFVEMLEDVELCLAPEYTLKGDLDKKLYAFLAGLLKGLLREAVAVSSFAARKVQVEMTWHWYQDKRRLVLELALDNLRPVLSAQLAADEAKSAAAKEAIVEPEAKEIVLKPSRASEAGSAKLNRIVTQATRATTDASSAPCPKLKFADEARQKSDEAAIAKKLQLYKHRDLSKAEAVREEIRQAAANMYKNAEVKVVYKKAQPQQDTVEAGGLTVKIGGPAGPSPYLHVPLAEAPRFNAPSSLSRPVTTESALATANQRIVSHLVKKVEEEHDQREMNDAQHLLAFQQARLEEETNRRLESDTYGAQAGRTCHPLLRRAPRQTGEAPVTVKSLLPSSTLEHAEALQMLGKVVAPAASNEESLSAYDHYVPTALDEERLKGLLTRVKTIDDGDVANVARRRHGLNTTHPLAMVGTSRSQGKFDAVTGAHTARALVAPRSDIPLVDQLHIVMSPEDAVPSVRRMEQLKLVDRIRDCFARATTKGGAPLHVPRSTIEKSILTPDDRPYEECIKLLPRPGSAFPANPFASADVKKDKKKGKAKAKK